MVTRKTASKARAKKVVTHACTQEEAIARINMILVGNGRPEDGLAFKVLVMHDNIADIKEGVKKLYERAEANAKAAQTAINAVESYRREMEAFDQGSGDKEEKERIAQDLEDKKKKDKNEFRWNSIANVIQIIAILAMIWIGLKQLKREATVQKDVEKLKVEVSK